MCIRDSIHTILIQHTYPSPIYIKLRTHVSYHMEVDHYDIAGDNSIIPRTLSNFWSIQQSCGNNFCGKRRSQDRFPMTAFIKSTSAEQHSTLIESSCRHFVSLGRYLLTINTTQTFHSVQRLEIHTQTQINARSYIRQTYMRFNLTLTQSWQPKHILLHYEKNSRWQNLFFLNTRVVTSINKIGYPMTETNINRRFLPTDAVPT